MIKTHNTHWIVDTAHSQVQFKVKHLAISNVSGTFKVFKGTIYTQGGDFNQEAKVEFIMDATSIDTHNTERDSHLKSSLFLQTDQFPTIDFHGSLLPDGDTHLLAGQLTICGISKSVEIPMDHTGMGVGRFGDTRAGFEGSGKIARKDFGLTFNLLTETGNLIVGEDIKLYFDIQLIKQQPLTT